MEEWTKGSVYLPNSVKIPIKDIKKCLPDRWKVCFLSTAPKKKKWRQFTELKPFFVRFDYLKGDQLGKTITLGCAVLLVLRCTPWGVRLAYRSSIAPLSSTGRTVLCFVSCGLNQTRGFSPRTPPWLSSVTKIEPCRDGNLLIGGILWRFL